MQPRSVWGLLALLGIGAVLVLPGVVLAAPVVGAGAHLSLAKESTPKWAQPGQYLSYNWAGYVTFDQANGSVTHVWGSWVEPAVTCPAKGVTYAAFWVGIDGFSTDAVEQDGTLAVCTHGTPAYYAWWELFPTNAIQVIKTMTVSPGDHMVGSVVYHPFLFDYTMSVRDATTGASFSITGAQAPAYAMNPLENSAECIIERPAEITSSGFTLLHLADFGTVTFSSCMATVNHLTSGVGNFAPAAILYMISLSSTLNHIIYLASPGGPVNLAKWSFTTMWQKAA